MICCRDRIQGEILPASGEGFLGQINAYRRGPDRCSGDGKRTGISETVKERLGCEIANEAAVFALVDKKTDRIPGREIDSVTEGAFERDTLQVGARIPKDENRGLAFRILFRQKSREDPPELKVNIERPKA